MQQIVQDMSAMETEALGLEDELQQEQRARQEAIRFLEMCSETCDVEKLKDCIKQENERLLKMINLWTPKVKVSHCQFDFFFNSFVLNYVYAT